MTRSTILLTVLLLSAIATYAKDETKKSPTKTTGTEPTKTTTGDTMKEKAENLADAIKNTAFTEEELAAMQKQKDCTSYKPPKRIQCDISLYMAKLLTDVEAQNDINQALLEWKREDGELEHLAFLSFNLKTFGIGIGMAEAMTTTWFYEIPLMIPRLHQRQYIAHATKSEKPTIVYATSRHEGNEIIDHWYSWTSIEGDSEANVVYVQGEKNSPSDTTKGCSNFLDVPKSVRTRKHVSIILKDLQLCETIPEDYRVLVGHYKEITINGLREQKVKVPEWECDLSTHTCFGTIPEGHMSIVEHFLG